MTPAVSVITLSPESLAALVKTAAKEGAAEALAQRDADAWLDQTAAARYVYGADGKRRAFEGLRRRYPALDDASEGTGRLRRWRRTSLDRLIKTGELGSLLRGNTPQK